MIGWDELSPEMVEAIGEPTQVAVGRKSESNDLILYRLCNDLGVVSFLAEDVGGVYVRFPVSGHWEISGLPSQWFDAWLTDKFFLSQDAAPRKCDLEGAVRLLNADAYKRPRKKTFVRLGQANDKIYLDLCNDKYEAAEIDATGWRIVEEPPVWFMRSPSMKSLPLPQEGGSFKLLREFANLSDDDFVLTVGWLVASMNPDGTYPLLCLSSEHGSGKSTLTTLLQRIIDPNSTERLAAFKDADALSSTATSRWIVPYDNLGKISEDHSNHLCRLATGGGYAKRQLYTDNVSFAVTMKRPVILNGIALILGRMDLLDRAYLVKLSAIPDGRRRDEKEFYAAFEKAHPLLLGALLSAVSAALRGKSHKPLNLTRMADAEAFVIRSEHAGGLPWPVGTYKDVLDRREAEKRDDAILDDPVAAKIVNLAQDGGWEGPLSNLLQVVRESADIAERPFLPQLPKALSKKLEELAPLLRGKGIRMERKKMTAGVRVTISKLRSPEATESAFDFLKPTG